MKYDTITADTAPLWEAYFRTRGVEERNVLFLALRDYFCAVVANWLKKRSYLYGRVDDVQAVGSYYLLESIGRVDPEFHPVKRMKYLIQTVTWQLHTYFNTTDKGTKRFHDKSINKKTRIARLDRKIDVADLSAPRPIDQLIYQESVDVIHRAVAVGQKSGRLSPQEVRFLSGYLREERYLPGTEYTWNWRNNCVIRFQAIVRELSGVPFTLYSRLRVPAKRFTWEVDSRGREVRIDQKTVPGFASFRWDDPKNPREARFTYGKWRFICICPSSADRAVSWRWMVKTIREDPNSKNGGYRWSWLNHYLQTSSAVRYGYGKLSAMAVGGSASCLEQLREKKVIE